MDKQLQFARLGQFCALIIFLAFFPEIPARAQNRPWPEGEKLVLEIFWPSGVSMGEATIEAKSIKDTQYFSAAIEVGLPQGQILYKYASTASSDFCSKEFLQSVQKPGKFWEEITKFDPVAGKATISRDGRSHEEATSKCTRDPLTLLYYYRARAAMGKKSTSETIFLGRPLTLHIDAKGEQQIKIKETERRGDRYKITYPTAAGEGSLELWLSKSAQMPIAVTLPLPLATFSAELRGQ